MAPPTDSKRMPMGMTPGSTADPLEWWVGGLVLLAYGAVLVLLGYLASWRRDVS